MSKKSSMNLPNRLTVLRLVMVPFCIAAVLIPESILSEALSRIISIAIFSAASITDCLDGAIARKYNLVTDFGKLMDPLADKFMVIGTMLAILYRYDNIRVWLFWGILAVVFRELAVTSMRLVTAGKGVVVAASILGKIKTVLQIFAVIITLAEPLFYPDNSKLADVLPLSAIFILLMTVMTVLSGADYVIKLWKYLDTEDQA